MTLRVSLGVLLGFLIFTPFFTQAAMTDAANAMCIPAWDYTCPCGPPCGKGRPPGGLNCPCFDVVPGGKVTGVCIAANKCEGVTYTGLGGASQGVGSLQQFMQIIEQVKGLLGGGQSGGGGGGDYGSYTGADAQGCSAYYQVTAPSSDPCAYYVPPTSSSLVTSNIDTSASDILLNALGGSDSSSGGSEGLINAINNTQTQTQAPATGTTSGNLGGQAVNLQAGTQGDITLLPSGATVIARSRDTEANTEVAGFYGSTISGGDQPQGLAARMCQSRPWSNAVVSFVIPPTFFDSLCASRGYQVGVLTPAVQQTTTIVQTTPEESSTTTQQVVSTVTPEADIWAVPANVPLGARTSIFWNTKGVTSCTVSSPEGNFEEHALSGGAATVPLSGVTTFVISCTAASGETIEDSVVVGLSI